MPKTVGRKNYFTFVGGLNTESGPLTAAPNTWQEGDNVIPEIDGSVSRRFGINLEEDFELSTLSVNNTIEDTAAFGVEEWRNVDGDGGRNFFVVQLGRHVLFYDNTADSVSPTEKGFTIPLAAYKALGNPNTPGEAPIQCASANGKLLITSADTDPILVTYDPEADTIAVERVEVSIRDLYGVDDGLAVDEYTYTLSEEHEYNLLNQGWDVTKIAAFAAAHAGAFPNNSQSWPAGKDSNDDFDPLLLVKQDFGSTPAPKGRFVLNVFLRNRSNVSDVPDLDVERERYRPTAVAFYAGRAWYAGVRSPTIGSWVMFSQVADTPDKYGKCYQDADPTSEFVSDLVDTDGGVIPIQEAGTILKLLPSNNSLMVIADNGVWQILGGLETGFAATSYEVRKLTSVGCMSAASVVEAEQGIYFWSGDGIWVMRPTQLGGFEVASITNTSIQSFFSDIPTVGRFYAQGRYYLEDKTIYWLYNDDTSQDGLSHRFKKNSVLCLDLRLGSFYTMSVGELEEDTPYIVGGIVTRNRNSTIVPYDVVVAGDPVITVDDNEVVVSLSPDVPRNTVVKFLTMVPDSNVFKLTFANFEDGLEQDKRFRDWWDMDLEGVSFDSYFITAFDLGNDQGGDRKIQGLYLTAFFRRTETGVDSEGNPINESSCRMQSRWDWTNSAIANKWGTEQQLYRHNRLFFPAVPSASFEDGYPVVVTKTKIRGRGRSAHFQFRGEEDKDMQLLGWSVTWLGNSNV